jgi:hypothetical protein
MENGIPLGFTLSQVRAPRSADEAARQSNPTLLEMGADRRRELHEALLDADEFEDLPGR